MRFKDKITIQARSDQVWEYVGSPEVWPLFHSKCGKCEPVGLQGGRVGALYDMEFRLGARPMPSRCEIVDLRIGRVIQLKSTVATPVKGRHPYALITFELDDLGQTTKVRERVEVYDHGINLFLRGLIWLISRLGKPSGETTLMKLKRAIEPPEAS